MFGMDTGTIGGVLVLPEFEKKYGIDRLSKTEVADLSANIVSTLQAGCFVGALAAAPIADKWGRKPALIAAAVVVFLGVVMQASADGYLAPMYIGRFIAGLGTGAASMVNPLYVSENAPRAIRGGLTGLYQLFIVFGIALSFWINYGSLQHLTGTATYVVPLSLQAMPAILLFIFMLMCAESPRFLAKQDRWEESKAVLARLRNLSERHEYVETEFAEIRGAIDNERMLVGGSSWLSLQKEMWKIPTNRKRALISVMLMICQQFTGTNAIVSLDPSYHLYIPNPRLHRIITHLRSSATSASQDLPPVSLPLEYTASSNSSQSPHSLSSLQTLLAAGALSFGPPSLKACVCSTLASTSASHHLSPTKLYQALATSLSSAFSYSPSSTNSAGAQCHGSWSQRSPLHDSGR